MKTSSQASRQRMIHIRIPSEVHKRIRIQAAQDETTMQKWILQLLTRALTGKQD